jgi:hypothetical protein
MFDFTSQQRGQLMLTMFFVIAFLGCFLLAALNLLVPDASVPIASVDDFELFSAPTIGGLVTALASLFVMTRT